jgi:hypothetical protein
MPKSRALLGGVAAAAVIGGGALALTSAVSGTESTTSLSAGLAPPGIEPKLIAGRIQSKFHPLPWVGKDIEATTCPAALPATVGATITCTAKAGDATVIIRVRVTAVGSDTITWTFER